MRRRACVASLRLLYLLAGCVVFLGVMVVISIGAMRSWWLK